ncbi:MAG: hypothetical protein JJU13_05790 [Balneolaceae bacterium]|jgi:hypothetical protein|nr:hypothetical protein [Balneolaceae bacterium]
MKVFISYAIENKLGPRFASETIQLVGPNPPFNKCASPPEKEVQKWLEQKQAAYGNKQKLTLLSISKVS